MNVITTKGRGWQKRCWDSAKAGEAFEVLSLEHKHVLFLQELCVAYDCKFKYLPGKVVLRFPRAQTREQQQLRRSRVTQKLLAQGASAQGYGPPKHASRGRSTRSHSQPYSTTRHH